MMTDDGRCGKEVKSRIAVAKEAFSSICVFFLSSFVLLCYGLRAWNKTDDDDDDDDDDD